MSAPPVAYQVEVHRDVRIPTGDPDVTLSADMYRPVAAEPVPALVTVLPYRKDCVAGIGAESSFRWLAARGYACLLVDFRGIGSSDGAMRPPFDPGEADDAVDAIAWAAAQPWCTGAVGMWGTSYGAVMTMRTASRRPPHLRAIVPIMGMLDPERDFVHPEGARGGLASLAIWGVGNLALQLTPPVHGHHSAAEQRRWRQRLHDVQPYIVDLFRHGPGHPVWRERIVDATAISVPALVVGGWRDLLCDGTIRAYEKIQAPKHLLMGPWMHTNPHESPFEAIDFLPIVLRWFDHWLRGLDNGVTDDPPVTLYDQGEHAGWRRHDSWPPAKTELSLAAGSNAVLRDAAPEHAQPTCLVGESTSDPTTGTLSGLWGVPTTGFGLPADQHDDDTRAVCATSEPLGSELLLTGRPEVTVRLADPEPDRLVVRLTDVDPNGRSTYVTGGLLHPVRAGEEQSVTLWPTSYRIPAGHRLRVVVSDADFPRLWPVPERSPIRVASIMLIAPTVAPDSRTPDDLPRAPAPEGPALELWNRPSSQVTRDLINHGIEVAIGGDMAAYAPGRRHLLQRRQDVRATVRKDAPEAAVIRTSDVSTIHLSSGVTVDVTVTARLSRTALWARGEVAIDGATVFSRVWEA